MSMRGVQLFTKAARRDRLSEGPAKSEDIAKRILSTAEKVSNQNTGASAVENDLTRNDIGDSQGDRKKNHPIVAVFDSDFFPVLLLLAIYTLAVFAATFAVFLWWVGIL
ncbi:hypothetical protein FJ938_09550 [Mesorhizobium sp. B2-4-14]|uniref:hypothetical protein n=1 Tax=Mesorhizobium sp. B2-4-14 TaxID=2589935 RepID=UPI001127FDA5|nr:hypothetical protein [Mesorhizobium sp. B2-4-14]TPL07846.1 hypothetical protein FJ938_09550 [Mesorhizobium sp. B2-4-14]